LSWQPLAFFGYIYLPIIPVPVPAPHLIYNIW
jgi:hypothetical protein